MKPSKIIEIALIAAVVTGIVAAILNKAESFSQLHDTPWDILLKMFLASVLWAFLLSLATHKEKDREITKIKWINTSVKLKHGFVWTALFFTMVLILGVNHQDKWVRDLHLVFTGLAILSGYLTMLTFPETRSGHMWANIGSVIGLVGFSLGFNFGLYTVSWAEVLASIPLAVFIYKTI